MNAPNIKGRCVAIENGKGEVRVGKGFVGPVSYITSFF